MSTPPDYPHIKRALHDGCMDMLRYAAGLGESLSEFEIRHGVSSIVDMIRVCAERKIDPPVISEMLRLGANPNGVSSRDLSPLVFLLVRMPGDRGILAEGVVSLLCAGADVNVLVDHDMAEMSWCYRGKSCRDYPLSLSIQIGCMTAAEAILLAGASPDGPDSDGVISALSMSAKWKEESIASLLVRKGANPNKRNFDGTTAMHYCWDKKTAQLLHDAGADLAVKDKAGRLPMHDWVDRVSDADTLSWLSHRDPSSRFESDLQGNTPLHILRERYASDMTISHWAGAVIAAWEADLMHQSAQGTQSEATARRL